MKNLKFLSAKFFSIFLIVFIAIFIVYECSKTDKEEQPIVKETGEVELKKKVEVEAKVNIDETKKQAEAEAKAEVEAEKKKQVEDAQKKLDSLFK